MHARTWSRTAFSAGLAVGLAAAPLATPVAAQTEVLDQGTFRLSVRGSPVGTETFSIRRTAGGDGGAVVAQGRVTLDSGEQTRALLQFEGPALRPSQYQIEVTGADRQSIRGQAAGNRFRAQIVSTAGETMREYLASNGAIILDEGVAHHYYFVLPAVGDRDQLPVIVPRQSRQITATVTRAGGESITIGGRQVQARRLDIAPAGLPDRTVWIDGEGRVLRVRIPDQAFLAERTELP